MGGSARNNPGSGASTPIAPPTIASPSGSTVVRQSGTRRNTDQVMTGLTIAAITPKTAAFHA